MESTLKERMAPCAGEERIFAAYPVPKVLLTMTLPTVISQIIYVIYIHGGHLVCRPDR